MQKYESIQELKDLKSQIDAANAEIDLQDKKAGWFDPASSRADRQNAIYRSKLPETIEVSPLLASYIAQDESRHLRRVERLNGRTHQGREFLKLIGYINLSMFNPAFLLGAGKAAKNLVDISGLYEDLMHERDATVGPVMNTYFLTNDSNGGYILKRSAFKVFQFSAGATVDQTETGVDSKLNLNKLPPLPPSISFDSPERGR